MAGSPHAAASGWSLWLIRHGETEWSLSGRHTGATDVPLTAAGEARAAELRPLLAAPRFARVYTSPMLRARRTAELAGFPKAEVTPLLREYEYGAYEGLTRAEIQARRPGWELFHDGCPDGETPGQVYERALRFCELAAKAGGDVLAFCHGHVSRAVTAAFLGWPVALAADLANLAPGCAGVLADGDRGRVLQRWNSRA